MGSIEDMLRDEGGSDAAGPGDVVRVERRADSTWLYCHVDEVLGDGYLMCSVIDAQSWPNLVADGVIPGRPYAIPPRCVLSIVRHSAH